MMIQKEGIRRSFQKRFDRFERDEFLQWKYFFKTLMSMALSQATGIPSGNHGLFHRYLRDFKNLQNVDCESMYIVFADSG